MTLSLCSCLLTTTNFESSLIINLCPAAEVIFVNTVLTRQFCSRNKSGALLCCHQQESKLLPRPHAFSPEQCLASGSETTHSCSHRRKYINLFSP